MCEQLVASARVVVGSRLTLELDLILNHQGVVGVIDGLGELGGDGMVGSWVLDHETLIAFDTLVDGGFLNGPLSDIGPVLIGS